jgi:hypothetical protein
MKKVLLGLTLIYMLTSCKEKLPSNIEGKVYSVEFQNRCAGEFDSTILSMNKNSIDNLSYDSLQTLIWKEEHHEENCKEAKKELEDILKYNVKYSDHPRIKTLYERLKYSNYDLWWKNMDYIRDNYNYINYKKLGIIDEKPKYNRV